jgi:predicted O-methyltransferase YrrM
MRKVEDCPYRSDVRDPGPEEVARCELLEEILGALGPDRYAVRRDACEACCAAPAPSVHSLNVATASLLIPLTIEVLGRGGEPGCEAAKAARIQQWAIESLPSVASELGAMARPPREGPCFHLGPAIGMRDCGSCGGSVRVKVFGCHHLLHQETTVAQCRPCPDYEPRLSRRRVSRWSVGVVTAPRMQPTLLRCLASLSAAGWDSLHLFAEPGVALPIQSEHIRITRRNETIGEWPNWLLGLTELFQRDPTADAYMMVQDDTLFCRGVREFLEAELWPGHRVGMVSVYCPASDVHTAAGWGSLAAGAGLIGALTCIFPSAAVRALLAHPSIIEHRLRGARHGLVDTDGAIGRWAVQTAMPIYHHRPSLAQHIGDTSTVWLGAPNAGIRHSDNFVGEDFDARKLITPPEQPPGNRPGRIVRGKPAPLVSCIMPTADRRDFARLALRYFLDQDYPNKELIVVDDGTNAIGDLFEGLPNVTYLHLPDRATIGEKRNVACREARGELIAHWDDDDWYAPGRLSHQVGPIAAGEADVTGLLGDCVLVLPDAFWATSPDLHRRMFRGDVHGGTLVYQRSLITEGLRYPELDLGEDASFLEQALEKGKRLARLENPGMFVYVRHGRNAWSFAPGSFLDPDGWIRIDAPGSIPATILTRIQKAAQQLGAPTLPDSAREPAELADRVVSGETVQHEVGTLLDCLRRTEITLPAGRIQAERCIATVASPGFTEHLDDLLGSLSANGGCPDALVVVFAVNPDPECHRVAAKHGATLIPCFPRGPINATLKAVLYSVAHVVDAACFLCLDADMLVLGDLRPVFGAIDACPAGSLFAIREANGHAYADLESALCSVYAGRAEDIELLIGQSNGEGRYPFVCNDGLFAGGRPALLALDSTIRGWSESAPWVDEKPDVHWRNQFIFNLVLADLGCGVELDAAYNLQLNYENVQMREDCGRVRASWRGREIKVLHFNGIGRDKYPEFRGRYLGVAEPIPAAAGGDAYAEYLLALRAWVGRRGLPALAWSFYGTPDGHSARVRDSSTFPLLALLHNLIRANGAVRVIETGTGRGVSTSCLASAVAHRDGGRVVTIDISHFAERDELWDSLPERIRSRIEPRRGDSISCLNDALAAGESYEAALIDTVHTGEHVWSEFQIAARLVCPGGLILIHDVILEDHTVEEGLQRIEADGYGVTRLWTADGGHQEDQRLGLAVIENRVRST